MGSSMAFNATYQLRFDPASVAVSPHERNTSVDVWTEAVDLDSEAGAYNEEAFRYFLDIERKRAELSNRALLLLLVDFQAAPDIRRFAGAVCAALTGCLRDTDFVGWYHGGRILGAVLTQRTDTPSADASRQVTERVNQQLSTSLPRHLASQLQVRVFELASKQLAERSGGDA
jgi:hypothetical protein